jgi:rare lipoprotein A
MLKIIAVLSASLLTVGCAPTIIESPKLAKASWYQMGTKTASGERYNPDGLTVAHKTYPFGTLLKLTNPENNKTVIARVNDRGPFAHGRELDTSRGTARELGFINKGVANLQVEVLLNKDYAIYAMTKPDNPWVKTAMLQNRAHD